MPRKRKSKEQEPPAAAAVPKRITPVDIQQKEFRMAMRGYHEQDVDRFLDEVTEEVARLHAENKRLQEELVFARTTRLEMGGAEEADAILRRAREEADRIVAQARARAAAEPPGEARPGAAPTGGSSTLAPFISRERDFLQSLADLIQRHAEAVKQELRRARQVAAEQAGQSERAGPSAQGNEPNRDAPDRAEAGGGPSSTELPTQAWSPPRSDPDTGERRWGLEAQQSAEPPGRMEARGDRDILDLTGGAIQADLPAAPGASRADLTMDDDEDRSIRELFWGED